MRNEGAKDARKVIKKFQEHINSPRLVPEQCYRMASSTFMLVCYVNQITGLFLSKNYNVIPIFLMRAHKELITGQNERVSEPYRNLVMQYLSHVAHFLVEYECLDRDEDLRRDIPQELLDMHPSDVPEDLIVQGEF